MKTSAFRIILLCALLSIGSRATAQTITYTQSFTAGVLASSAQCNAWTSFRTSLAGNVYSGFTISGSLNPTGITCTNASVANAVANALATGGLYSGSSDGHTWQVANCTTNNCGAGSNVELDGDVATGGCSCATTGYSIRPGMAVAGWWGGINGNCSGVSQTLTVTFFTAPVSFVSGTVNGSGIDEQSMAVCQNALPTSINTLLTVSDRNGLTETWSVSTPAIHGTVNGLSATAASSSSAAPTGVTYTPTAGFSGIDSFKIQVNNGSQTAITNIVVTVNPAPVVSGGANVGICTGGSATLTATGATTYTWAPAASLSATTGTSVTASPTVTTVYTITGTNGSGCVGSGTVTVSMNPTSAGTISGSSALCNGQTTTLTSTVPGGVWSSTNSAVASIGSSNGAATGVSLGTATIKYTVTNTCGTYLASYPITVNMAPAAINVTPSYLSLCPTGPAILMSASGDTLYGSVSVTNNTTTFVEPQNAADTSSVTVSGVPAGAVITSVVVTLNSISPKSTAQQRDNYFNLRAPNGSILNLDNGRGSSVSGFGFNNVTISSAGTVALPTTTLTSGVSYIASLVSGAPTSGSFTTTSYRSNVTAWSSLYSVPNGQWTLITDNSFNATEDTFNSWSITINYAFTPSVTWTSATGLYTNSGATTAYTTGTSASSVYALPASSTSYTATATIGSCSVSTNIPASVNSTLYVPVINGPSTVCPGATITLTDSATGGNWVSNTPGIATIGAATGIVTGVAAGTVVMTYNYSSGTCANQYATKTITVNALPVVASIGGNTNLCLGSAPTSTLTDATTAGTFSWSSGNTAVATIGSASGVVTGLSAGSAVITYSFNNGTCTNNLTTTNVVVAATPTAVSVSPALASICPTGPSQLLTASGGTVPATTTTASGTIAFSIPYSAAGLAGVTTPLTISGIPAGATVTGIAVNFNATESFDGDLELNLEAPNAQVINLLSTGTTNSGPNYVNTTISSAGTTPIPNAGVGFPWTGVWAANASPSPTVGSGTLPPTTTTWAPLLAANPNGVWTLVGRTNFSGNTATLTSWSISISYTYQAPVTWSATAGLYTNAAATVSYTGTATPSVFALPASNTVYTATATNGSCTTTQAVTAKVGSPLYVPVINGPSTVCVNGNITMTDSTTGGVWSSSNNAVATVNPSTGVVTGVSGGTANIIYTVTSGLCSGSGSKAITVNALPVTAAIAGPGTVCSGSTITLTDATAGGTWASSNTAAATINTSGVVSPVSVGSTVISYSYSNGTCTNVVTTTVNSLNTPAASVATPATSTICFGGPSSQLNATGGAVAASSTFSVSTPQSFGPGVTATSPVTISGIPVGAVVTGISVNFNASQNSGAWDSDDLFNLQSPNGHILNLVNAKGGSASTQGFVNTTISSAGTTPIPATGAPYTGTYAADTILGTGAPATDITAWSGLYGSGSINGTWNLIGNFIFTSGSTTLNSWSITINYTVPPVFTWAPTTGLFTNAGATTAYTGSAATTVYAEPSALTTYTLTASNGACTSTATSTVTVNPLPVIGAGASASAICFGGSSTLTATGGVSYTWAPATGLSATTGAVVTATPAGNTTYTVTGTSALGCMNTATVTVTVNPLPSPITGNLNVCASGGSVALSDATTPGTWTSSNANAMIGSASGIVTGVTAGNSVITYTLPTTCYATAVVTVYPLPVITGSPDTAICLGSATPLTASGGVSYSWAPANGLSATTGATVVASPTVTTTYTITGTGPSIGSSSSVISYVQSFVAGVSPTTQCTAWTAFRASLDGTNTYTGFTIKGSQNTTGISCTDPVVAAAVASALHNGTPYIGISDGQTWRVNIGGCTTPVCGTLYVELANQGSCSCASGYVLRPTINNSNWGGIGGATCSASSQTMEVDFFVASGCTNTTTVTVSVNPLPTINTTVGAGTAICNGSTTTLTATGANTYSWSPSTGLSATTGTSVDANPSADQTYVITGTDGNGCVNNGTVTVTVNPLPAPISGSLNFCIGTAVALSTTPSGGTWTSSNTAIGTVDAVSGSVSGLAVGVDTITYTLPTGCAAFVSGTVNPVSDVAVVADQTICNGASTTPVSFTGSVPGTIFNWVNSDPTIGLAATGTGDILSFSASNASFVQHTGAITVIPSNNGCPGTTGSFNFIVNPTPDVNPSANQTKCNGAMTDSIPFTGDVAGTIFTWTNSNSSIGIGASGTGDIASFAGIDTSTAPVTSVVTVMTSAAGCTGSSNSFTITINPSPLLNSGLIAPAICDSALFSYMPGSATTGTSFNWSRAVTTGIANAANSGVDNPMEFLDNTSGAPVAVTYVYAMAANGCTDTQNVSVTVNPKPTLSSSLTPPSICDSTLFHYPPTSLLTGVTFAWSRATVTGILNPAQSGTDTINEYLDNITTEPVSVPYVETLTLDGCSYAQTVVVAVNPKPVLNNLPAILPRRCDSSAFMYVPSSATTGTTFTWSRAAIVGNPARSGVDTISEILVNNTTASAIVTYIDTLKANGCSSTQKVQVEVMPSPVLSSTLTPTGICDSAIFNYTPASATAGTTFAWVRPFVLGINKAAGSGTGNPNEQLINTTNDNLNVTYVYTMSDSGCSHSQNVVVTVHPTPVLSSPLTATVCTGTPFVYGPTSFTAGTTFRWNRGKVAGLAPATDTGSGVSITETFTDSLLVPITTGYQITLTANGCPHLENIVVTVNPAPPVALITTYSTETNLCSNTLFQNFGTSSLPPAGLNYTWLVNNAELYAEGSHHQYCLVDFKNPGTAVVTLNSHLPGFSCISSSSVTYNVGSGVSDMPQVTYFNGQFVCLQNNMDSYQWGYDDAITLDSTLIQGEVNPNYFISSPDLTYKYYWVITTHNGCMQKTYYNIPSGVGNVNVDNSGSIKVYPNPASEMLDVEINTTANGMFDIDVVNILGQKLQSTKGTDHKARLNVASLPAGTYLVVCYRDGVKMDAVRFVKN